MLTELPNGWIWTKLEVLAEKINPGFPSGKHNKENRGIPHIRPMNISLKGEIDLAIVKYVETSNYEPLLKGYVLFNNTNSPEMLGKTTYLRQDTNWAYSNHMTRIRLFQQFLEPAWVAYYLHFLFLNGFFKMNCVHHVNQASINSGFLSKKIPIPLAPLTEQRRIVARIEELFSHLDTGVEALQRAKAQLRRYRQAVFKAAMEGRLTEEWRRAHPEVEPAEKLLERVSDKKWEREKSDQEILDLPEVPHEWGWANLGAIGKVSGGLTKNSKRNDFPLKMPYLRVANVYAGELRLEEMKEIGLGENELEKVLLNPGDLLVVEGNGSPDQIGRVALWDGSISPCVHQNHIIKVRFDLTHIGKYVLYWLLSINGRKQINKEDFEKPI
jgi:type I restriction enzyme S subunit